ncbi:MAG: cytochrome c biogenesis CcdA family protein [Armatimonadota bacterium]
MTEFVTETIPRIVSDLSPLAYLLVFFGGVLTSIGPCNLSMAPVLIGYVGGQHQLTRVRSFWLSLLFTLGSSATFVLLGVVAASVGGLFGTQKAILYWLVALVCFAIGLNLLGAIKLNFDFLARLQPKRVARTGLPGAFLLGLVVGLAGSQCATPILAAILGIALATGKPASCALLLFCYGLGRGVPIVIAGTFTGVLKALPAMERWTRRAEYAAGGLLMAAGLYFIWMA